MVPASPDQFRPHPPAKAEEHNKLIVARDSVDAALNRAWQAFQGDINQPAITAQDAANSTNLRNVVTANAPKINPGKKLTEQELQITQAQGDKIIAEIHSRSPSFERVFALTAAQARMQRLRQEVKNEGTPETRKVTEMHEQVHTMLPEMISRTLRTMDRYASLRKQYPAVQPNVAFEKKAVTHVDRLGKLMQWRVRIANIAKLTNLDRDFGQNLTAAANALAKDHPQSKAAVDGLLAESLAHIDILLPPGPEKAAAIREMKAYMASFAANANALIGVVQKKPLTAADAAAIQNSLGPVQEDALATLLAAVDIEPDPAEVTYTDYLNRILQANYAEDMKVVREPASANRTKRLAELKKQRQELLSEQVTTLHDRGAQNIGDLEELLIPEALRKYIAPSTAPRGPERTADQLQKERKFMGEHVSRLSGSFRRHFKMVLEGDQNQAGLFTITPEIWQEKEWNEKHRFAFITVIDGLVRLRALARPSNFLRQLGIPFGKENAEFHKDILGEIFEKLGLPKDFNPWDPDQWNKLTPEQQKKLGKAMESVSSNIVKFGPKIKNAISVFEGDLGALDRLRKLLPPDDLQNIKPDMEILGRTDISEDELKAVEAAKPPSKEKLLAMYLVLLQKMRRDWREYSSAMAECSAGMLEVLQLHTDLARSAFDAAGRLDDDFWLEIFVLGGLYTAGRFGRWGGWSGAGRTGGVMGAASDLLDRIPYAGKVLRYLPRVPIYAGGARPILPFFLRIPKDFLLTVLNPLTWLNGVSRLAIDPVWWLAEKMSNSPSRLLAKLIADNENLIQNGAKMTVLERTRLLAKLEKDALAFQQKIANLPAEEYEALAKQLFPNAKPEQLDLLKRAHAHGTRLPDGRWEMETLLEKHRILRGYQPKLVNGKEVPILDGAGNPIKGLDPADATKALRTGMAGEAKELGKIPTPLSGPQKAMLKSMLRGGLKYTIRGGILGLQAWVTYEDWKELSRDVEEAEQNEKDIKADLDRLVSEYPQNKDGNFRKMGNGNYEYVDAQGQQLFEVKMADLNARAKAEASAATVNMDIVTLLGTGATWIWQGKNIMGPVGWGLLGLDVAVRTGIEAREFQKHYTLIERCPPWLWVRLTQRAGAQGLTGRSGDQLIENRISDVFVSGKSKELKEKVLLGEFITTLGRTDPVAASRLEQMCSGPKETGEFYEKEYQQLILPLFHQFLFMTMKRADVSWQSVQKLDYWSSIAGVKTGPGMEEFQRALQLTAKAYRAHVQQRNQMDVFSQLAELRKNPGDAEKNAELIAGLEQSLFEMNLKPVLGRRLTPAEMADGKTQVQLLMEQVRTELKGAADRALANPNKSGISAADDSWAAMMLYGNPDEQMDTSSRVRTKVLRSEPFNGIDNRANYNQATDRDITIFTTGIPGLNQKIDGQDPRWTYKWFMDALQADDNRNIVPAPEAVIAHLAETNAPTRSDAVSPEIVENRQLLQGHMATLRQQHASLSALSTKVRAQGDALNEKIRKRGFQTADDQREAGELQQQAGSLQSGLSEYYVELKKTNDISIAIKADLDRRQAISERGIQAITSYKFTGIDSFESRMENVLFKNDPYKPFVVSSSAFDSKWDGAAQELVRALAAGGQPGSVVGVMLETGLRRDGEGEVMTAVVFHGNKGVPNKTISYATATRDPDGTVQFGMINSIAESSGQGERYKNLLQHLDGFMAERQRQNKFLAEREDERKILAREGATIDAGRLNRVLLGNETGKLSLVGKDAQGRKVYGTKLGGKFYLCCEIDKANIAYKFVEGGGNGAAGNEGVIRNALAEDIRNWPMTRMNFAAVEGKIAFGGEMTEEDKIMQRLIVMPREGESPNDAMFRISTYAKMQVGGYRMETFEAEMTRLYSQVKGFRLNPQTLVDENEDQMRARFGEVMLKFLVEKGLKEGGVNDSFQAELISKMNSMAANGEFGSIAQKNAVMRPTTERRRVKNEGSTYIRD